MMREFLMLMGLAITALLMGMVNVPETLMVREYGQQFEFAIRILVLIAYSVSYRWYLESND